MRQTPHAWTFSSTWPGPGSGAGRSTPRSAPARSNAIARILESMTRRLAVPLAPALCALAAAHGRFVRAPA